MPISLWLNALLERQSHGLLPLKMSFHPLRNGLFERIYPELVDINTALLLQLFQKQPSHFYRQPIVLPSIRSFIQLPFSLFSLLNSYGTHNNKWVSLKKNR